MVFMLVIEHGMNSMSIYTIHIKIWIPHIYIYNIFVNLCKNILYT